MKKQPSKIPHNAQPIFFSVLAWLPKRPILGRNRNLIGSPCLLSTISLTLQQNKSSGAMCGFRPKILPFIKVLLNIFITILINVCGSVDQQCSAKSSSKKFRFLCPSENDAKKIQEKKSLNLDSLQF